MEKKGGRIIIDDNFRWNEIIWDDVASPATNNVDELLDLLQEYNSRISSLWQQYTIDGRGFTIASDFVSVGTAETDFFLLINPANSGKLVRLQEFLLTQGGTAAQKTVWRIYRNPIYSSPGIAVTILKILSTGNINTILQAYKSPVITNRGTFTQVFSNDFNTYQRLQELGRYITPSTILLITVQPANQNIPHNFTASWAEI